MRKQYHHGDLKNALIRAGAEILASEGAAGLTLRKAAQRAGVSHSAPYAHFPDKQALVTAISTAGLRLVGDRIGEATARYRDDPLKALAETAWETVRFALEQPDQYRVTFSNAVDAEDASYAGYLATARESFSALVEVVRACQEAGVVAPGPAEIAAVGLWSLVHGLAMLLINNQVPGVILSRSSPRELLFRSLASHLRSPALEQAAAAEARAGKARGAGKPDRVKRRPSR